MPGFDGTGPWGTGPRTGGARGFCQTGKRPSPNGVYFTSERYAGRRYSCDFPRGAGRGGPPPGGGRGRAFGGGRGRW